MSNTITVRLPKELAEWVESSARRAGVSPSQIIQEELERTRQTADKKPFMKLAGSVAGPKTLSKRKGFSR